MQPEKQNHSKKKRQFICPCGKQYLSYPALYTHIKSSHKGKPPGQIQRPQIPDRGRPKINEHNRIKLYKKKILESMQQNPIQQLTRFVNSNSEVIQNITKTSLKQLIQLHPLYQVFQELQKKQKKQDTKQIALYIPQYNLKNIHTGAGLAEFLLEIQQKLQYKGYLQIYLLILLYIEHIIQESQDYYVLKTSYISFIIEFANDFIINGLKEKTKNLFEHLAKDCGLKQLSVIDKNLQHKNNKIITLETQNSMFVLDILFKWLIYKQYTLCKAFINQNYVE